MTLWRCKDCHNYFEKALRMQPNQEDVAGSDARESVRSVYAGLLSNRHLARAQAHQV